jgi:hypothetical protein
MFIVKFNKSVIVTYLGVVFGCLSMYFAFSKVAFAEVNHIRYSLIFLMLAGVCDMFDGKIARMCKRTKQEKEFGIQLDSLADTYGLEKRVTPIGFKYIGKDILDLRSEGKDIILAGEESGGLTIKGHIPEKDGILANLLILCYINKLGKYYPERSKLYGCQNRRYTFNEEKPSLRRRKVCCSALRNGF